VTHERTISVMVLSMLLLAQQARTPSLTGTIERIPAVRSQALGNERDVLVYLPPQYAKETKRKFPVLYLHDGQNVFDGATSYIPNQEWKCDEAAESLIGAGLVEPIIMVAIPNMGMERANEYLPTARKMQNTEAGGKANLYLKFIRDELKPLIDRKYRTKTEPTNTGLCGSSFGGIATLYLGLWSPETFGKLAVVSPSVWWDDRKALDFVSTFKGPKKPKVWLDMGSQEGEGGLKDAHDLRDRFVSAGWKPGKDFAYYEDGFAVHNEGAWARRFPAMLMFLFPKR